MSPTLDQKRAQFAWEAVNQAKRTLSEFKEYKNLAKGAPALIMGNGLMAALAYYQSRDKAHASRLMNDILGWLMQRNGEKGIPPFPAAMSVFHAMDSQHYMRATDETLSMLKWLRQFADAVSGPEAAAPSDTRRPA